MPPAVMHSPPVVMAVPTSASQVPVRRISIVGSTRCLSPTHQHGFQYGGGAAPVRTTYARQATQEELQQAEAHKLATSRQSVQEPPPTAAPEEPPKATQLALEDAHLA